MSDQGFQGYLEWLFPPIGAAEGDYIVDGLIYCGQCKTPKQKRQSFGEFGEFIVTVMCSHYEAEVRAERKREAEEREAKRQKSVRVRGLIYSQLISSTFKADRNPESNAGKFVRRYAESWPETLSNNLGIMMMGAVGTGKTYYAAALANHVIDSGYRSFVTTVAEITAMGTFGDRVAEFDTQVERWELMVLDDLGSERNTEYSMERLLDVVNRRYEANLPMVVTTNLTEKEMRETPDLTKRRIYDRVLQMCPVRVSFRGLSKRPEIADERLELAKRIMKGDPDGQ